MIRSCIVPLRLLHLTVNGDGGEVAFHEQFVQFGGTTNTLDKNDQLVEFQGIEEVHQFSVLFAFLELDKVLLEPVQSQLSTFVDVDFQRLWGG